MSLSVRASSLPNYLNCPRRAAAQLFRKELKEEGYLITGNRRSAGSVIGTTLHVGAAEIARQVKIVGYLGREEIHRAVQNTINRLDEEFAQGATIFDATTKDEDQARIQIERMMEQMIPLLQSIQPTHIEHSLEKIVSPLGKQAIPVKLTGTLDIIGSFKDLYDHKSGAKVPYAHAQLGAYMILCKLNDIEVNDAYLHYIKRCALGKGKYQLPAEVIQFTAEECISAAWATIRRIQADYEFWLETKDPWSFCADASSMICTPKYCDAFDSKWCRVGVETKGKKE